MAEQEIKKDNQLETKEEQKIKKIKIRTLLVLGTILIFGICLIINTRANYIELREIGEKYIEIFNQNLKYRLFIGISNFVFIFLVVYITNKLIKKGLKVFFEQEKIEMPKLPNKSIALILALIATIITPNMFLEKFILFKNNTQFGINDPIFNMDVGFYMFQAPFIELLLYYLLTIVVGLTIYTAIYYIVTFNVYFEGIDGQTLKGNIFIKHLLFNAMIGTILIAGLILLSTQNMVLDSFLTLSDKENTNLVGTGMVDSTIKLWGYRIFAVVIIISVYLAIISFKKDNAKNVVKYLAVVPAYLVILFFGIIGYKAIFINGSELDKQKSYITTNIDFTKTAYNLKIDEIELNNTGTITAEEAEKNEYVINNTPVITEQVVLNNLKETQASNGYYTYNNAKPAYYKNKLTYISAREINNANTTYNSKSDEYTHGFGAVFVSANEVNENGNIIYVSKDFEGKDIKEPRIYYGMETNSTIPIEKDSKEFDYPKTTTQNAVNSYNGNGGITPRFLDKIVLSINERKLSILTSGKGSKILLNRNIRERAKKVIPYLIYDEEPYLAMSDEGNLYWVIDAYTISDEYPYSQKTKIVYEDGTKEFNYIRNSVKVIVDAYNGDINFYIMDKTDPIVMVYNNMFEGIFKEQEDMPKGIQKYFTYSEFLYKIQAERLTMYHDVSADVLYRGNDIWQIASYSKLIKTTASTEMNPIYTTVKTANSEENKLGLVLAYNLYQKESMKAYLVGTIEEGGNKLSLYKFSNDTSVVGPIQLDSLIEQDEIISKEISNLSVTGTRISKEMIIVPIDNTILYIIPIYQTSLNEKNSVTVLKKIVVASGNKIALGNNLNEALENLLSSNDAVSIEVEDTSTIEGLIDSIIKANNNLTESNKSNDWSQIGRDIQELQTLVQQLQVLKENADKEKEQEEENNAQNVIENGNILINENVVN